MISTKNRIFAFIVLLLGFLALSMGIKAQNVVRKGNMFIAQEDTTYHGPDAMPTTYTYKDSTGVYPVYISKNGKAFIKKVSKKTGRVYPKYLPKVTEQINKEKNGTSSKTTN